MTIAIGKALLDCNGNYDELDKHVIEVMQDLGNKYNHVSYGEMFRKWLKSKDPKPYNSYGNGAPMRVSCCGIVGKSLDEAKMLSRLVTKVTHNHPKAIKGAEAVTTAIFLARQGKHKREIFKHIKEYYYELRFNLDEIRESYEFDETTQGTVPYALAAFFESKSYIDAVRLAVSIGGDSDTITAITSSIAGEFYGIPRNLKNKSLDFLDSYLREIVLEFQDKYHFFTTKRSKKNTFRIYGKIPDEYNPILLYKREIEKMKMFIPYLESKKGFMFNYYKDLNDDVLEINRIMHSVMMILDLNMVMMRIRRTRYNLMDYISNVIDKPIEELDLDDVVLYHYYIQKSLQWGFTNDLLGFITSGKILNLFRYHINHFNINLLKERFKSKLASEFILRCDFATSGPHYYDIPFNNK